MKLTIIKIPGYSKIRYKEVMTLNENGILHYVRKDNGHTVELKLSEQEMEKVLSNISCLDFKKMTEIAARKRGVSDASKIQFEVEDESGESQWVHFPIISFGKGHHLYKSIIVHFIRLSDFLDQKLKEQLEE